MSEKEDEMVDVPVSKQLKAELEAEAKKRNLTIADFVKLIVGEEIHR